VRPFTWAKPSLLRLSAPAPQARCAPDRHRDLTSHGLAYWLREQQCLLSIRHCTGQDHRTSDEWRKRQDGSCLSDPNRLCSIPKIGNSLGRRHAHTELLKHACFEFTHQRRIGGEKRGQPLVYEGDDLSRDHRAWSRHLERKADRRAETCWDRRRLARFLTRVAIGGSDAVRRTH